MNNLSFVIILLFFLVAHLTTGQTATISDEAAYQRLENQFESGQVSSEQLFLFEKKGIQHLKDFMNLVEMISSKEMDQQFLDRFEMAAINYFSTPNDSILIFEKNEKRTYSIKKFVKEQLKNKSIFQDGQLSNLESSTPIFLTKKYQWTITFQLKRKEKRLSQMVATLILKKEKKKFGDIEKEIWEVFLKKIEELP